MKFKINPEEIAILRQCAAHEAQPKVPLHRIKLEPGIRVNTETDRGFHMNIALLSDRLSWPDTDLHDYGRWADFKQGQDLTEDGRGIFDFYIRKIADPDGDLYGNVTAFVENDRLVKVIGYDIERGTLLWEVRK